MSSSTPQTPQLRKGHAGRQAPTTPARTPAATSDPHRQLDFLVGRYLLHHQRQNHTAATLKIYRTTLAALIAFFQEHGWRTDIDDDPKVILEHTRAWMQDLAGRTNRWGRPYAADTLHQCVRSPRLLQLAV